MGKIKKVYSIPPSYLKIDFAKENNMSEYFVIIPGLFILAIVSGMLGLGVAFASVPFLGLFFSDLVHQVQPISLLLNGITAMFCVFGFAKSSFINWRKAIMLAIVTTFFAPVGSYLAQFVNQVYIWYVYFISVAYLAYRIFKPVKRKTGEGNFRLVIILAIPISVLSGFLGVGPGFLLMPTLIVAGFEPKMAAGINAFAVCPPSFSALIPHLSTAYWDTNLMIPLIVVGAIGSFIGARITSLYLPGKKIKRLFGILMVVVTLYKIYTLMR